MARALGSGWVPAAAVVALTGVLLHVDGAVAVSDIVRFLAYVLLCLTLPGTLLWRWLGRRHDRPVVEDLVLGTMLGYALELPTYLVCRAVGAPRLVLLLPVAALVLSLATRTGRSLWGRRDAEPMSPAWSWSLAAVVAFSVRYLSAWVWAGQPVSTASPTRSYVDEPFHLSLVGELRHHVPPTFPFVEGVPLDYHWLTYVHVASSSWATGVEPVVLLRTLTFAAIVPLVITGVAVAVARLGGRPWAGVAAAGLLVLVMPLDVFGWTPGEAPWAGARFLAALLYLGPTQTYATMLSLLLIVVLLDTLREERPSAARWVVVLGLMVAVGGAKSTFLPIIGAGLVGVLVLGLVVGRRPHLRAGALLVLTAAGFLGARLLFYGPGSRSLTFDPLGTLQTLAAGQPGLLLADGSSPAAVLWIVGTGYLAAHLAGAVGVVGLVVRGGWRQPSTQFLCGAYAAAMGATLLLQHPAAGQFYFLASGVVPLALATGLGWSRLVGRSTRRLTAMLGGAGVAAGAGLALTVTRLTTRRGPDPAVEDPTGEAVRAYLVPMAVALAGVCLLAVLVLVVARLASWRRLHVVVFVLAVVTGLGLTRTISVLPGVLGVVEVPETSRVGVSSTPDAGVGGLEAARWLRSHSSARQLVATNSHCRGEPVETCDRRAFWMSGYSERRVLVEGWAYIAPETVGLPSDDLTNSYVAPFWDPERLRANDRVFNRPTQANIERLRDEYGVDWLLVDRRFPVDLSGLGEVARPTYAVGEYVVLRIRP